MKFTNTLLKGKLQRRYKRFFVDIEVNNKTVVAHCPNTGSMMGLLDQGNEAWICLLYTSPSPRDLSTSRMPSSA